MEQTIKIKLKYIFLFFLIVILSACSTQKAPTISKYYLNYINDSINKNIQKVKYNEDDALYYFINGEQLEQQEKYADAIIEFQDALRLDTNAVIFYALGNNYLNIRKIDLAEDYFIKSINYDNAFIPALEKLGELYMYSYKHKKALKTYKELVKLAPTLEHLNKLAFLYQFSDLKKAAEIYEKIRENNEDFYLLMKLANIYLSMQDTTKYVQRLELAYKYSPDDLDLNFELIKIYLTQNKYEKAEAILRKSNYSMLSNDLSYLYESLAAHLMNIKDSTSNIFKKSFLKMIDSRFYFDWKLQSMSGIIASQINDSTAAKSFFNKALTVADSIPEVTLQLANYYIYLNLERDALLLLNKYQKFFPDDYRFLDLQALAYFKMDSLQKSISLLQKSMRLNKESTISSNQLAIIYDRQNMIDSADYYYQYSLKIDPNNALANNNYAYSLAERNKNLDKALTMIKISLEDEPDNASYLDTYGWILFKMGNYNDALENTLKASLSPNATAEVFQHIGDIYIKMGEKDKAIEAWKKGLDTEPDNIQLLNRINEKK